MASDDETNDSLKQLDHREQFPGWKSKMSLLAMAKGDTDGIFADQGDDPNVGFQTYGNDAAGRKEQREWRKLSKKLTGIVGSNIGNSSLRRIWTDELNRVQTAAGGAETPYLFAKCMAKLEVECARKSEEATQIARGEFTIALQSFVDKPAGSTDSGSAQSKKAQTGFAAYVDGIRNAEEKLTTYGVNMSDAEKKQLFYAHFTSTPSRGVSR